MLKLIGIDLDDLLTKDAAFFVETEEKFFNLLKSAGASSAQIDDVRADFYETEKNNILFCGYGVGKLFKTFIDFAVKYAPEQINAALIKEITGLAENLRHYPLAEFEDTREFLARLRNWNVPCVLITKGESFHQIDKVARLKAALGNDWPFEREFILSRKTEQDYRDIIGLRGIDAEEFLMVGDSIHSDGNPVLKAGGHAVIVARSDMEGLKRIFEDAKAEASARLKIVPDLATAADTIEGLLFGNEIAVTRPEAGMTHNPEL